MSWETYSADVLLELPKGSTVRKGANHNVIVQIMYHDGKLVEHTFNNHLAPERMRRVLTQNGWRIIKNKWHKPEEKKDEPVSKPQAPTDAARKAKRDASTWIDEAFDIDTGRYRAGVSDKSIGEEVGLSEDAVAAIREDFFGPLKEPEEVAQWRSEIKAIRKQCDDMQSEAADTCTKIINRLDKLSRQIENTIQRNGW